MDVPPRKILFHLLHSYKLYSIRLDISPDIPFLSWKGEWMSLQCKFYSIRSYISPDIPFLFKGEWMSLQGKYYSVSCIVITPDISLHLLHLVGDVSRCFTFHPLKSR